ncbi:MAG: pyrophosphohydrolase [Candidatus Yonathbacteria bacterium]|nr:pyrophosphohydrolase [Candidatus Yonathbacteria bacterium]
MTEKKESSLNLKTDPTLKDFQKYVADMGMERGFGEQRLSETFMIFLEECGEMAKAARKSQGIKIDKNSNEHHLDFEIADVFINLLKICNDSGVDLEKAFRDKEEINKQRIWS